MAARNLLLAARHFSVARELLMSPSAMAGMVAAQAGARLQHWWSGCMPHYACRRSTLLATSPSMPAGKATR